MVRVRDGDTGAQPAPDLALPPHLEHGAVLEDVLLVTHHAVLIERRDPLLRVLHDLRGRTERVRPRRRHGAWRDAPGGGMGMSGMWNSKKDILGIRIRMSRTWGSGENALHSRMRISGKWDSEEDALGSRMQVSGKWDSREDALGSRMLMSGMRDSHLDEEAILQRGDVLAVAADL